MLRQTKSPNANIGQYGRNRPAAASDGTNRLGNDSSVTESNAG